MASLAPFLLAVLALCAAAPAVAARELLQSAATISPNITQLSRNGESVGVTFTNPNPSVNDAIAFVVPDTADYKKTAPQKIRWAIESGPAGQYLATKQGTLNFPS
ncbi:hypothetical protein KFL_004340040 [Klebsormidium nitens]|uniref:Uncharacterized protein n=1 Tax=Klebsormidium nitens TaxID=105231 RepID=A0A1Y1IIL1_KLENI|nr:hypothetical protein KFL_004340040 [Klebsormidium nitens]|eukprot:GAQ88497.1 hypothetical protein KFL_004340040 [Klebsormidium nitens]